MRWCPGWDGTWSWKSPPRCGLRRPVLPHRWTPCGSVLNFRLVFFLTRIFSSHDQHQQVRQMRPYGELRGKCPVLIAHHCLMCWDQSSLYHQRIRTWKKCFKTSEKNRESYSYGVILLIFSFYFYTKYKNSQMLQMQRLAKCYDLKYQYILLEFYVTDQHTLTHNCHVKNVLHVFFNQWKYINKKQ